MINDVSILVAAEEWPDVAAAVWLELPVVDAAVVVAVAAEEVTGADEEETGEEVFALDERDVEAVPFVEAKMVAVVFALLVELFTNGRRGVKL